MSRISRTLTILIVVVLAGIVWNDHSVRNTPRVSETPNEVRRETRATGDHWGRPETLGDHFQRHGADFKARDAADYARQAHAFLQRAYAAGFPAKRGSDGALRDIEPATKTFGAYNANGTTRTYFKARDTGYLDRQEGERVNLRQSAAR